MADTIMGFLIENTLIVSLLIGAVWLVKVLFKKHLSAMMQYALWGIVILKLLIPVSMNTAWSPVNFINGMQPAAPTMSQPIQPDTQNNPTPLPDGYTVDNAANIRGGTPQATTITPTYSAARTAAPFNWNTFVIWLWPAGSIAYAVWLGTRVLWLRRKVRRCTLQSIPQWMEELLLESRWKLGIHRNIRLVLQGALPVPAISGVIRPVLMVPARLAEEKNAEKMRHVFLHELMHYKRRDLPAIWLLNVLQAVYWWNPLVWVCFRTIHRDMETACDSQVIKVLGTGKRKEYIGTVLSFSGKQGKRQVQAALNLNDGCTKMKKRIHGMFLRGKTKGGIRFAVALLAIAFLFAGFTTGCQPTPENPAVINKNNGKLEQKINQGAEPEGAYDAPATWKEEYSKNKAAVKVDAKVVIPDVTQYPVFEAEAAGFSQAEVDRMAKVLMQGKPLTQQGRRLTKAELTKWLIDAKMKLEEKKKDPNSTENSEADLEERIRSIETDIAKAPEKTETKSSDGKLKNNNGLNELQAAADLGKSEPASLWVIADAARSMVQYRNGTRYYEHGGKKDDKAAIQTSKDEAVQKAKQLLSELGVMDMEAAHVAVGINIDSEDKPKADQQGYIIDFTRTAAGIPTLYEQTEQAGGGESKDGAYAAPWFYERITVCVDDSGVTAFEWRGRVQVKRKISENVALMPFQEVMERLQQQMLSKYAPGKEDISGKEEDTYYQNLIRETFRIDRIVLSMQQVAVKDKPGKYMLLPAWKFLGAQGEKMDVDAYMEATSKQNHTPEKIAAEIRKNMEENNGVLRENENAFVTINAIDGSLADPNAGY